MTKNKTLASIEEMLRCIDIGYSTLVESAKKAGLSSIDELSYARDRLTELKRACKRILGEFQAPLTVEEAEAQNHAVALLNAVNSAFGSYET